MSAVLYGKHPGFGDFLSLGLERGAQDGIETWLQKVLPATRVMLGAAWEDSWDMAPDLRFWIGPDILDMPLCGIWRASRDRVGRRYPLMLGLGGVVTPPPVHGVHDAATYVALSAHLDAIADRTAEQGDAQGLIEEADLPPVSGTPYDADTKGMLWGTRKDDDLDHLFRDAIEADAFYAQYGRSHWWQPGTIRHEAGWLSINGLPDAEAMCWLLTSRVRARHDESAQTDTEQDDVGSGRR
ncbi:MAG: type VI secretion system-associated protein TagF [Tateyamaria sp.]|uniref:type VI secretion system-associated protein TagF n=1 Tax=Tateyamaria sp. TaxID=1929288 RepID=UPI00329EDE4A